MNLKNSLRKRFAKIKYPLETYKPNKKRIPKDTIDVKSAWQGLELIIEDILEQFDLKRDTCIEFGVEFCYSTVVFSNFFKEVRGIDLFIGDKHSGEKIDHYAETMDSVSEYKNIQLIKSDYRDYIKNDSKLYDFAHVDIIHSYKETYECGLWAIEHSNCCIFHDTESFPELRRAVFDLAKDTGKKAYNYPYHNGLGIIL